MESEIEPIYHQIGKFIAKKRNELNFSQINLCHFANISITTLQTCEKATKRVQVDTLERICKGLNLKLSDLFLQIKK